MLQLITILFVLCVSALFGAVVPLPRLFDAFQPMVVALSVIVAAVFVRLNRGMPSLEWKSLDRQKRAILTAKIVELSREYVAIVAVTGIALISLVTIIVIGKDAVSALGSLHQKLLSALIGGLFSLCLARMSYVVWRDCDIMILQKHLIDAIAEQDEIAKESNAAKEKIAAIKSAGLNKDSRTEIKEL